MIFDQVSMSLTLRTNTVVMKGITYIAFLLIIMLCTMTVHAQVTADFTTSEPSACGTLQVSFFDQSTSTAGGIVSYSWDLGIANSSLQNPGAIYTSTGSYTVCLTVTDVAGNTDTECKADIIKVLSNPIAAFEVDITEGCAPVTATFENTSTSTNGPIVSFLWDIGGSANIINTTDYDEDIGTTYTAPGTYAANLIVVDSAGCQDVASVADLVQVNGIRPITLDVEVVEACELPWIIEFSNLTPDPTVTYSWDFGNGQSSTESQPGPAIYTELGSYDLTVYMQNGSCTDTAVFENVIDTERVLGITTSSDTVCAGSVVDFGSSSAIPVDSIFWDFGDGNTSADLEPSHTYILAGCYTVTQISYIQGCQDTSYLDCVDVLPTPTVQYEVTNQFTCELPAEITIQGIASEPGVWNWDIPGLPSVTDSNASFIITEYGDYYAQLTFVGDSGCEYTEDSILINVQRFEVQLPDLGPQGCAPLSFTLGVEVDTLQQIVDWQWSVGEGLYTASESNPTLTIPDTGRYDIELIVTNSIGCMDTVIIEDYVRVGQQVEIDFEGSPLTGCKDVLRDFFDLSVGHVDYWEWQFEDDNIVLGQNPSVNLDKTGIIDVSLTVYQNGCPTYLIKPDYLEILEPDAQFGIEYNCTTPYEVVINNSSTGADSTFWSIETSPGQFVTSNDSVLAPISLPDRGLYAVYLYTESFTTGCTDEQGDTIIITDPIAGYSPDTLRGCSPLTITLADLSQDAFQYQYITTNADIDTTDVLAASVTYTESGSLLGPLLIITDIHECKDSFQLADSIFVNDITAAVEYSEVVCVPSVEMYADSSTDLLSTIVKWDWSLASGQKYDSTATTSYEYNEAGIYSLSLRVEDEWGCTDSVEYINAITAIELLPDFTNDSLGCTFAPIQYIAGGVGDVIDGYLWEFGDGATSTDKNPSHTYDNEGLYTVCLTIIDDRGCQESICKEGAVLIQDPIAAFTGDPLFSTCPPMLSEFMNTSQNAVSYQWNFGDGSGLSYNESPSRVYTAVGSFDVTLVAEWTALCKDTLVKPAYIVVEGPQAEFNVEYVPSCIPQPITLQATSVEAYDYVWDYGNGVLDSVGSLVMADTILYEYNQAGTYAPKLIITDDKGCTRSFSGEAIRVDEAELAFDVADTVICGIDSEVSLVNQSTATTDDITYTWLLEGAASITTSEWSPIVSMGAAGYYTVALAASYGGCQDTLIQTDLFEIGAIPTASFDITDDLICADIDITVTNTSAISDGSIVQYLWQLPSGETLSQYEPAISAGSEVGEFDLGLIATSQQNCSDTTYQSFEVNPSSIAVAGPDQLICIGDEAALIGTVDDEDQGVDYYWQPAGSLSCTDCTEPIATPDDTTTYVYTAVHPSGCISYDSVTVLVAPVPAPTLTLSADSLICLGNTSTIVVEDFDPNYTYIWNPFQGGLDCYFNCEVISATPSQSITYEVGVLNEYGCSTKDSVSIEVEESYDEFVIDRRAVCEGDELELTVLRGAAPTWTGAGVSCTNCDTITVMPTESTYYIVEVGSPLGCRYTDSIWVDMISHDSVDAGDGGLICAGEGIALTGSGTGIATWHPTQYVTSGSGLSVTAAPAETTYMVLTVTDDACTLHDSVLVDVRHQAEINAIGDTICPGEFATVTASGTADAVSWYYKNTKLIDGENLDISADTTMLLRAIGNFRTCDSDTAEALLYVHPLIDYELADHNYVIYTNDDIDIQASYDKERNYSYTWLPSEGLSCDDCPDPEIRGLSAATDYALSIVDVETGCYKELDVTVNYVPRCNKSVFGMANIFAPGRGGHNSTFGPSTENEDEFISITIFDRWGTRLFYSTEVDDRWDGQYAGDLVSEGVYVYIMELYCPETDEFYSMPGDVTVIR